MRQVPSPFWGQSSDRQCPSTSPYTRPTLGRDINIISIGGASRSGSTLLSLIIGGLEGFFPVGELRYVWSRGCLRNFLCGCGVPFRDCPFWRAVMGEAYGGFEQVPIREIETLQSSVSQIWDLPQLLSRVRTSGFESRLKAYLSHLERLCRAIHEVSQAQRILDSSKLPSYCFLFSLLPRSRVAFLHLVRDSRAVAFSFGRKKRKVDIHWTEAYMRRFSPFESAVDWNALNGAMELIRVAGCPYRFLRYEDLVAAPASEIGRILPERATAVTRLLGDGEVRLTPNHTVSGNPIRLESDTIQIRLDTEWKTMMRDRDRHLVTAMTWPLLLRYRYLNVGSRTRSPVSTGNPAW